MNYNNFIKLISDELDLGKDLHNSYDKDGNRTWGKTELDIRNRHVYVPTIVYSHYDKKVGYDLALISPDYPYYELPTNYLLFFELDRFLEKHFDMTLDIYKALSRELIDKHKEYNTYTGKESSCYYEIFLRDIYRVLSEHIFKRSDDNEQ